MFSRNETFPAWANLGAAPIAALLRHFWMIMLIVTVGALSALAYGRLQVPMFEAVTLVGTPASVDANSAKDRLLSPENLREMAARHGIGPTDVEGREGQNLGPMLAIGTMTAAKADKLGLDPATSGLVVSVLWPDAEIAARLANDLAQQLLDAGRAGMLTSHSADLAFYRREERRLWQEVSALRAELDFLASQTSPETDQQRFRDGHRLQLMQDQHEVARRRLAELEVDQSHAAAFAGGEVRLLRRATAAGASEVGGNLVGTGVVGSLLLAIALAFVLERRFPALHRSPWGEEGPANRRLAGVYRFFDDPQRPILGLPRFVVVAGLVVAWLIAIAVLLR